MYRTGLIDSPVCKRRGAEEEIPTHVSCECEALATLTHTYVSAFSLEPEDVRG